MWLMFRYFVYYVNHQNLLVCKQSNPFHLYLVSTIEASNGFVHKDSWNLVYKVICIRQSKTRMVIGEVLSVS